VALREFYKDHYTLEGARKNDLAAALSLPVGILSLILGALVVMAKELHLPLKTAEVFQLVFISLSASACALCAYFVFRSLYGFAYGFVPTAMQLQNYEEQLRTYHVAAGRTEAEARSLADTETLDYLYGEFAKNADRNSTNNDIKSAFLHKCHGAIIAAVVFASAAGIAYVYASSVRRNQSRRSKSSTQVLLP